MSATENIEQSEGKGNVNIEWGLIREGHSDKVTVGQRWCGVFCFCYCLGFGTGVPVVFYH